MTYLKDMSKFYYLIRLQPLSFAFLWRIVAALLLAGITISCSGTTQEPSPTPITIRKFVPPITPTVQQGTILFTQHAQGYPVWSSNSTHMAFTNGGNTNGGDRIYIWDASTRKLTQKITLPLLASNALGESIWSPDGQHMVFASDDGRLQVWSTFSGRKLLTYNSHSAGMPSWTWAPDGKRIAMTANSGNGNVQIVQIWDVVVGKELLSFSTQMRDIYDLVWSPDGGRLASLATDRTVQFWNATTGNPLQSFHDPALEGIVWSPDGRYILSSLTASVTKDTSLRVWDVATGRKLLTYSGHSSNVYEAQWSPDSTRIVSVGQREVLVWNASTGHTILSLPTTSSGIAVLSPDGKYLAYSRGDNGIQVWNTVSGNEFLSYVGPVAHIQAIAWSLDSTRIAFASDNSTVQIWNTITKNTFYTYHVASNSVQYLIWSPDNKLLATASQDNTLQVLQAG